MNIYKISQDVNDNYDTYDSAIVAAHSEKEAKMMHPHRGNFYDKPNWDGTVEGYSSWCNVEDVKIRHIGIALEDIKEGIILASFNAG